MLIETHTFFRIVEEALLEKKPLSLVRYGDGEAIVLNGFKDVDSLKAVFKRQFGKTLSIDATEEIRQNLIKAYTEADYIGSPLGKKIKEPDSYWAKAVAILYTEAGINLIHATTNVSIDIHSELLVNNYIHRLIEKAETLNYISCRDLDEQFKKRFPHLKTVNKFIIAPETKFTTNTTGEDHYPTQYNHVQKWMDRAINCEGALCLVGAGVVGKIYCNQFRDRGGIALDIGSVFDSFAGKDTRGSSRGFNKVDNEYKL
jgi:hypothetical protein